MYILEILLIINQFKMKKILILFFITSLSISSFAQDKIVLKQTFIKVKPGNNYAEDLKTRFNPRCFTGNLFGIFMLKNEIEK